MTVGEAPHGYSQAQYGTTYNAFVIKDEKTTLIDTVKADYKGEFFCNLSQVVGDLENIDYIVANHLEPDHAGCLVEAVERIKPEKIFVSPMEQIVMRMVLPNPLMSAGEKKNSPTTGQSICPTTNAFMIRPRMAISTVPETQRP